MTPYRAAVVMAGEGAMARGIYLKFYELRLFGGLMKAQSKKGRKNKPFILARRLNGEGQGPKWMKALAKQINSLEAYTPQKIQDFLNMQPEETEQTKIRCIIRPTLKDLGGLIEEDK